MVESKITVTFPCNIEKVWNTVTSLENYSWRSDISKIEVLDNHRFIEYTKEGYPTYFTITSMLLHKRWEFDIENDNMTGHWTGIFSQDGANTTVDFTESVSPKRIWMRPFVKSYLKKQQKRYMEDLESALK